MKYSSLNAHLYLSNYHRIRCIEVISLELSWKLQGKQNNVDTGVSDKELISLFKKVQFLPNKQKDMVKDFLSTFMLKAD